MKRVSQIELAELTQKDRKTIRYLLANLKSEPGPRGAKLYPSSLALETIYLGSEGAITNTEVDDVNRAVDMVFKAVAGTCKANLSVEHCNEVFSEMRRCADRIRQKADEVDGSSASALNRPALRTP